MVIILSGVIDGTVASILSNMKCLKPQNEVFYYKIKYLFKLTAHGDFVDKKDSNTSIFDDRWTNMERRLSALKIHSKGYMLTFGDMPFKSITNFQAFVDTYTPNLNFGTIWDFIIPLNNIKPISISTNETIKQIESTKCIQLNSLECMVLVSYIITLSGIFDKSGKEVKSSNINLLLVLTRFSHCRETSSDLGDKINGKVPISVASFVSYISEILSSNSS